MPSEVERCQHLCDCSLESGTSSKQDAPLDISAQQQRPRTSRTEVDLGMQRLELLDRRTPFVVRDQMAELPQDVGGGLDQLFVGGRSFEVGEDDFGGVGLFERKRKEGKMI